VGRPRGGGTEHGGAAATAAGAGEGTAVLVLREECLRQGVGTLRRELAEALEAGTRTLVVDVCQVRDLSSTVVALLLRAKRCCRARGGHVVLRGLSRAEVDVLHRTGLSPLFEIEARHPAAAPAASGSPRERSRTREQEG
ncbi:STAS domain-containing protein, partial [Kineococcus sp. T13]|uniref:STAS domain-containing protein n=1 Tax=Kineococcus vitellinus TaxID=2696565 RepID=UPI0014126805